jgi:hypothetical protein
MRVLARNWLDLAPPRNPCITIAMSHTIFTFVPHYLSHILCIPPLQSPRFHPLLLYILFILSLFYQYFIQYLPYFIFIVNIHSVIFLSLFYRSFVITGISLLCLWFMIYFIQNVLYLLTSFKSINSSLLPS